MTLEKIAKNYVIKPALSLALAGSLSGCGNGIIREASATQPQSSYEIVKFGTLQTQLVTDFTYKGISQIEVADFDGDGDLDVIIGYTHGRIEVYENKIPQKNKPAQ